MTPIDLDLLTARVERLERITQAMRKLYRCHYETDCAKAERELREAYAYESKPKIPSATNPLEGAGPG